MIEQGSIWKKRCQSADDGPYRRVVVTGEFEGEVMLRPADPEFGSPLTCTEESFRSAFDLESVAQEQEPSDPLLTNASEWATS